MRKVFYSFHYARDYWRVQQIRNMGIVDGNKTAQANKWEEVKRNGDQAIKNWINSNFEGRTCLIVLVGEQTASRPWVKYEIEEAWKRGLGVLGIYIHLLKDQNGNISNKGQNPFNFFTLNGIPFSQIVKCHDPILLDPYGCVNRNINRWIEDAINIRNHYN